MNNETVQLQVCKNHDVCFAKDSNGQCTALNTTDWPNGCPFWKLTKFGPNEYDRQHAKAKGVFA